MADGLFLSDERFMVMPENGMDAAEDLFRARVITFLWVSAKPLFA